MNNLPNFICVGAQKSGTTTLHDILTQHPDIYLPSQKETHFFDKDEKYKKGKEWWLYNYYNNYNNEKIIGDITPEYLFYDKVPERIFDMLGKDVKIIFILRNPIDRAYSHYLMSLSRGFEKMSFEDAVQIEKERIQQNDFNFKHFSYLSRGFYYSQIKKYLQFFSHENMLFLSFENDIVKNIDTTVIRVADFLAVNRYSFNTNVKSNVASKSRYKFLTKILNSHSSFKQIIRFILPLKNIRECIIIFLRIINKKKINYTRLSNEILDSSLLKDIDKLNNLTNGQFRYFKET